MTVRKKSWFVTTLACAALILSGHGWSGGEPSADQAAMEEMMAAQKAAGEPGKPHLFLERLAGRWEAKIKAWMGPGEPVEGRGVAMNEMIFGGRFLRMEYKGEMMGETYVGLGLDGYDNVAQKYTGVWLDSMSTSIYRSEGECAQPCMARTMHGVHTDPLSGRTVKSRTLTKIVAPDEYTYKTWEENEQGEEVKTMEIVFRKI